MIKKRLELIFSEDDNISAIFFNSFKEIHIHLFEHGLYPEFQITNTDGKQILHYETKNGQHILKYTDEIPGNLLFEIIKVN